MGQVYVGLPSANSVNTWRYEPGRLVGQLNGNIYRVEIRDAVSVFAHISNIRLRTTSQAKPYEISHNQDVDNPVDTQRITCECCDMSTIYDFSCVTIFKHFMIIKDSSNRDHWIDLAAGTDWTKIDLCFASASRRGTADTNGESACPPSSTTSAVGTILLPATTNFVHQSNAAYILNMLDSFVEAFKITGVLVTKITKATAHVFYNR
ncbi:hypothetical protein AAVH_05970 [Aphelenchoides avenae]|nr:hypothetical protein AAVH_05970 [Aphelenchus avenae]